MISSEDDGADRPVACLLPPWWGVLYPERDGPDAVARAASRMIPDVAGVNVAPLRIKIELAMREPIAAMAGAGVQAWLYEAEPVNDVRMGASIAVLPMPGFAGARPIEAVLALATQDSSAHIVSDNDRIVVRFFSSAPLRDELRAVTLPEMEDPEGAAKIMRQLEDVLKGGEYLYFAGAADSDADWVCCVAGLPIVEGKEGDEFLSVATDLLDQIVRSIRIGEEVGDLP
ncbi:hypothetical protein [Actinomyces oricola]